MLNRSRVSCHAETSPATLMTGGCPETMRSPGDPLQRDAGTRRLRVLSFRRGPKRLDDLEYTWIGTVSPVQGNKSPNVAKGGRFVRPPSSNDHTTASGSIRADH